MTLDLCIRTSTVRTSVRLLDTQGLSTGPDQVVRVPYIKTLTRCGAPC